MAIKTYSDLDYIDVGSCLVGRSIVSATDTGIVLDNGTELEFEETENCCAWFGYDLECFDFENNVITRVEEEDLPMDDESDYESPVSFSIVAYSTHKKIMSIDIQGDETSGFYGYSIAMKVKVKD